MSDVLEVIIDEAMRNRARDQLLGELSSIMDLLDQQDDELTAVQKLIAQQDNIPLLDDVHIHDAAPHQPADRVIEVLAQEREVQAVHAVETLQLEQLEVERMAFEVFPVESLPVTSLSSASLEAARAAETQEAEHTAAATRDQAPLPCRAQLVEEIVGSVMPELEQRLRELLHRQLQLRGLA